MSRRNLLVAAWVGGLVTVGGVAAMLVLVHLAVFRLPAEFGLAGSAGILILSIFFYSGSSWLMGIRIGLQSIHFFTPMATVVFALVLKRADSFGGALIGATILIGPSFTAWSLGCLRALRGEAAKGGV